MGVMKRNLLLITAICLAFSLRASASITPEQASDPEYLINSGFSEMAAEEVEVMKNRTAGKPVEPLYDKSHNKFVRFWRNIYGYIDPAVDTDERLHHDIHPSPSWRDL